MNKWIKPLYNNNIVSTNTDIIDTLNDSDLNNDNNNHDNDKLDSPPMTIDQGSLLLTASNWDWIEG